MLARRFIPWVPVLLLAFVSAGCGHSQSPTAPHMARVEATAADVGVSPGPPLPAPPIDDTPQLSASPSATLVPQPNHLFEPTMPPTFTFHWAPNVPAPGGPTPTHYRYRLFSDQDPEFDFFEVLVRPDSLVRHYAPGFPGWTDVDGGVTQATLHDLSPEGRYVIVLIALDDRGHFDNVVSFDRNAQFFRVSLAAAANVEDTFELPRGR